MEILPPSENKPAPPEAKTLRRMRWFFVLALSLWTLAAIAAPVVTFCLTRSPLSFSLFSTVAPPVYLWYRLATHLFPIDEKTFELKKLRIQTKLWNNKNF